MNLWDILFGGTPGSDDEPDSAQAQDPVLTTLAGTFHVDLGSACDELPGATGLFGQSPASPIPVNGPAGESVYLNRLRSHHGFRFLYHRLRNVFSPVTPFPVDEFELVSADGTEWLRLFFDMYHPRRSRQAPTALTLTGWQTMDAKAQTLCKMDFFGAAVRLTRFPLDLPEAVNRNRIIRGLAPELGRYFADQIRACLASRPPAVWNRPPALIGKTPDDSRGG